jgi:hypothetical protein
LRDCDHCPTGYRVGPHILFSRAAMNRAVGDQWTRGIFPLTTIHCRDAPWAIVGPELPQNP